ncbi:MAG TPA: Bcr/CflA family multidrug efflux MFS transporter [Pusillimonas sp.]|uniref:Bcr/CflA family multidrug efflux MFS transporter n=1 Tax=Pusillimonas sp. TaxID=3040095 RepID=UPI002C5A72A3|nr:Bcr/CflA family multidrug efflux MFS transporter [Pusillimonas sp.]HUH86683.1 Bcr/CflA family multidrug efflux MFS transporter [Pusillimonas sp.]
MPSRQLTRKLPGWLLLMGALTALGPLAIDMYLPSFPSIVKGLGATQGEVERTLASYLIGLAAAQIIYGPLADRYGRKRPLLAGLVIFSIASVGCAFTTDIEHLTLWRILQALGGAAGIVIPRAVVRDNLDTRDAAKALSILLLIMGATPILGPIIGGQVLLIADWRGIFGIMAVVGVIMLVVTASKMRETLPPEKVIPLRVSSIFRNYWGLLRHRQFICYSLAGGLGSAGIFTFISGAPRVLINIYGVPPQYFGFLFGLGAASLIFTSQLSARLLDRHSPERLLKLAQIAVAAITLAGLALTLVGWLNLPLLMLCLMGFMASQGFVNPNAAALALSGQGHRLGVASAMMGTVQMIGGAIAGISISYWQADTALPLIGILTISVVLSWLFGALARRAA